MYGKNVTLINETQEITVFVYGTPNMTAKEWEREAKALIKRMTIK
jgi:hypothetical protein